jgi:hypothetical protein
LTSEEQTSIADSCIDIFDAALEGADPPLWWYVASGRKRRLEPENEEAEAEA